jgi:8-oxo-dGTP pyrophosphatase MutT (NUDIX family)
LIALPADKFVFVKQWRPLIDSWTIEAPGGIIDNPESPDSAVRREVMEELGIEIPRPEFLGTFFLGVGYSNEVVHAFTVIMNNVPVIRAEPGISPIFLSISEFCSQSALMDGKTLAALQLLLARGGV